MCFYYHLQVSSGDENQNYAMEDEEPDASTNNDGNTDVDNKRPFRLRSYSGYVRITFFSAI
jgi:hypothetical protein